MFRYSNWINIQNIVLEKNLSNFDINENLYNRY